MCTRIDQEATKKMTSKLKVGAENYAWKIVKVRNENFYAPLQFSLYKRKQWNSARKTLSTHNEVKEGYNRVAEGVFHCFRTRQIARTIKKALKMPGYTCFGDDLKIVKVVYRAKDFFGIGNGSNWASSLQEILNKQPLDTICVKNFKIVE